MELEPDDEFMQALDAALSADREQARAPVQTTKAKFELKNISHMHEAIMNWMIANPHLPLKQCAAYFNVTQSWLSVLIHSDIFQARLREKQELVFSGIKEDLNTKIGALADVGVEKLLEKMEDSDDPRFIKETTDMALKALGFGAKPGGAAPAQNAQNIQNNFYSVSPADLEAARKRMQAVGAVSSQTPQAAVPVDTDPLPLPAPEEPQSLSAMRDLAETVMLPPEQPRDES